MLLCLPVTKAALISAAVVSFLVTTGTDVYSISSSTAYASAECTIGVWTTSCTIAGASLSFSSSDKRFEHYEAAIATEIMQIAAIIFGSFAALWYIISVVVLMQSQKPMSWKGCGIALHVTATVFGALLPSTMVVWKVLNDSEDDMSSGAENKTLGPAMYFAIFGSILVVTSSFLACAECCCGGEVQTSAQPLQQVLYYPAPGNAVVEAVGSGARMGHPYPGPLPTTEQPYASVQMAE